MAGRTSGEKCHDNDMSSSPAQPDDFQLPSPPQRRLGKEKRNPSITPRKFRRFFTPRSRVSSHGSPACKALRDIALPELNRLPTPALSSPPKQLFDNGEDPPAHNGGQAKRRKINNCPESSPCQPSFDTDAVRFQLSNTAKPGLLSPIKSLASSQEILEDDGSEDETRPLRRLSPLTTRGLAGHLLQRQLGAMPRSGRSYMSFPVSGL